MSSEGMSCSVSRSESSWRTNEPLWVRGNKSASDTTPLDPSGLLQNTTIATISNHTTAYMWGNVCQCILLLASIYTEKTSAKSLNRCLKTHYSYDKFTFSAHSLLLWRLHIALQSEHITFQNDNVNVASQSEHLTLQSEHIMLQSELHFKWTLHFKETLQYVNYQLSHLHLLTDMQNGHHIFSIAKCH